MGKDNVGIRMKRILYPLLLWFALAILAILNGSLRQFAYGNYMPELLAHQLSTFLLVFFFLLCMFSFFKLTHLQYSQTQLLLMGSAWLLMTILFEFGFGHFVIGHSWQKLFADYNLLAGRLWPLLLLATLIGPYITYPFARKTLK